MKLQVPYKNCFTAQTYVASEAVQALPREDLDRYTHYKIAEHLAGYLASNFKTDVVVSENCGFKGLSDEIHSLTLNVFTNEQLQRRDEELRKEILMTLAADNCLKQLPIPRLQKKVN